jgi:four helix bundle protein
MPSPSSFEELRVWQEAMRLAMDVYRHTADFPKHEVYGITQQMRRAAVSIQSNIAEGKGHRSNREFSHFLFHARGSLLELQAQLMIATELQYLAGDGLQHLSDSADRVGRARSGLINSLSDNKPRAFAND